GGPPRMKLAIPKERRPHEKRVAASPDTVKKFKQLGLDVVVETGAGMAARIPDTAFAEAGATIAPNEKDALAGADIVLKVQRPTTDEIPLFKKGAMLVAILAPYADKEGIAALATAGIDSYAMEFM